MNGLSKIWLLFFLILLVNCTKENEEPVLLVTPYDIYITASPHEILSFNITCQADVDLHRLLVTSKELESFTQVELDTSISGTNYTYRFEFPVPEVAENTTIYLEFTMEMKNGETVKTGRVIEVLIIDKLLEETAGHEMYSRMSGKENAYDLYNGDALFSHLSDSSLMHIMDTTSTDDLLNRWISPAGALFIRFNDFDYANCTNSSVKDAFNSGANHEFIDKLFPGDILLLKLFDSEADSSYIALKITSIHDDPGNESDRYIFNIKK
ncbi:MAG: hypothetical protein ISS19_06340 [Bacteroidales bacterium]|nr:hypothetical protein [Bacteroidales bacterium]